jgi:uncharacterized protein YdeI (YjbR/CyaY-like superfamily)
VKRVGARPRPRGFRDPAAFRAWLEANGAKAKELYVRCTKAQASRGGVTYRQALDEALCRGWIDGVRHALDAVSFSVRFTPRKPRSAWSRVNVRRFRELQSEGRVAAPGLAAFEAGVESRYSFESRPRALAPTYLLTLRKSPRAWRFFAAQPPWYRRSCAFWLIDARRAETRARRLALLIACSRRGEWIPGLKRPAGRPSTGKLNGPRT